MTLEIILIYAVFSFFYIISPGPAVFLAISNGMTINMKAVSLSSFGNVAGLFILSSVSMFGLGALIAASASLFLAVKVVGAGYLIFLGIKQFRNSKVVSISENTGPVRRKRSIFYEGFWMAVTNPKPILFFTALFPQFLNVESALLPQFFILTGIFMFFSFLSLYSYGLISKFAKGWISDARRMAWFHRVTGGIFIAMGIGLLQLKNTASN